MQLTIRSRHFELPLDVARQIARRIQFALSRLGAVQDVDLTITDINGPRGGADKQCRVRVRGPGLRTVVIDHIGFDTLATASVAVERAARSVVRAVARRRAFTRPVPAI